MIKQLIKTGIILMQLVQSASAQDPQFSQFFSNPLHLNPALTGNTNGGRLTANYRMQWAGIPGGFRTYAFSYDHYISSRNSGLGVQLLQDHAGSKDLRYTVASMFYSYIIKLNKKWAMSAGFSGAFVQKGTDYSRYTFSDQIVTKSSRSTDLYSEDQVTYLDFGTGLLVYSSCFFAGISAFHVNKPNESLIGERSEVPTKLMIHAGFDYPLEKNGSGKVIRSYTIAANYKAQNKFDQFDVGGYYNRKSLILGIWYRGIPGIKAYEPGLANNDAIVFLVGLKKDEIQIGYSYDVTISRMWSSTYGSHEISISYRYKTPRKTKIRTRKIFCPKF